MSTDQIVAPENVDVELIDALMDHYGLSGAMVTKISEISRTEQVAWVEAATRSGLVTSMQLQEAIRRIGRRAENPSDGVVQTALQRSAGRQVVVVEGPTVEPGRQLVFAHDPYDPRSEKMRSLRTELLLLSDASTMILALVGSGPMEGRSVLAAELAMAFAQLGRSTLLVDADMRKPSQHLLFQTSNNTGLAQSIEEGRSGIMCRVSGYPTMSLLTAGIASSNPLELLSSQRFQRLADSWRKQFKFIIVDTPPVNQFTDGLTVATWAGRVLVVSRSVASTFRDLNEMLRRLALTRSEVLGAVINHF